MILIGAWGWLSLFGNHLPYFNSDPRELARYLVESNRPAKECWDLVIFTLVSAPPPALQRANCIEEYAKIVKDPSVCSLLMPSEYGLGCMNESISPLFTNDADAENVTSDINCSSILNHQLKQDNCWDMHAHRFHDIKICRQIQNSVIRTECEMKMDAWNKYPKLRTSFNFGKYRQGG